MAHLITHRPRMTNLRSQDENDESNKRWETFSAFSYVIGGVLFIGGVAIYYRKQVHNKLEDYCKLAGIGTMFIHDLRSEIEEKSHFEKRHETS